MPKSAKIAGWGRSLSLLPTNAFAQKMLEESSVSCWAPACGAGVRSLQHLGVTGAELHGSSLVLSGGLSQGNVHC